MGRICVAVVSACLLMAGVAESVSSASTVPKLKIIHFSLRVEKQIDGYVEEALSISVPKGTQPIKSLRIGEVSGVQYEGTRRGVQVTRGGKSVPHTAALVNSGSEDGAILLSFTRAVTDLRVSITTPAVISCGVAGVLSPYGTITVDGADADGGAIPKATAIARFSFVKAPAWWHPSQAARNATC